MSWLACKRLNSDQDFEKAAMQTLKYRGMMSIGASCGMSGGPRSMLPHTTAVRVSDDSPDHWSKHGGCKTFT